MMLFDERARIDRAELPTGRRILVISDIHGNLPYLDGLLKKCAFSSDDELIFNGDFLEKGRYSLATLHRVMELCARGNARALLGNCDGWSDIFGYGERGDAFTLDYIRKRRCGLLWDMLCEAGTDPMTVTRLADVKPMLKQRYAQQWEFLEKLPQAIETDKFVFAHAGMRDDIPLSEHTAGELMRCDALMRTGRRFEKWLIVGHYPVVLYGENTVCANPVIDRESRIVSIDGGCVLKDDGQLNALIIPDRDSSDFSFEAYDGFPVRRAAHAQEAGKRSYYIRWGDNEVRVLRRGTEFSLCRHERTGYEMEILTKYLFSDDEFCRCNDCTDYVLPVSAGDELSIVEETSRGYFVKRGGVSGWYFGKVI